MKIRIQAAVVALFAASVSQAQQAVQWKVSDGGNGHWYRFVRDVPTQFVPWTTARDRSVAEGGYLTCIGSSVENDFVWALVLASGQTSWAACGPRACGPFLGGYRGDVQPDPSAGWMWVDGSPWSFTSWAATEPANGGGTQNYLKYWFDPGSPAADWGDDNIDSSDAYLIEWSADCNNDGIVDYGQCRDGSLPDYNGNNIPDCCEQGTSCVVGSYPVQWRVSEGGNGHWYFVTSATTGLLQSEAQAAAVALGGHLLSACGQEFDFAITSTRALSTSFWVGNAGPWIGLTRLGGYEWRWLDGTACMFDRWESGQPNNGADVVALLWSGSNPPSPHPLVHDHTNERWSKSFLVEWSADCNSDGIVDYGQILQGQLPDTNDNGVPDTCEVPTCIDADIYRDFNVNGADLGILLSQWGPNTPLTESDLNMDGAVDGLDLGLLLSFWGPCP